MYQYKYKASFVSGFFNSAILDPAVKNTEKQFNALARKRYKHISVRLDCIKMCLDFTLESSISISPENWLRAVQYFSKELSKQSGMQSSIWNRRLLERK